MFKTYFLMVAYCAALLALLAMVLLQHHMYALHIVLRMSITVVSPFYTQLAVRYAQERWRPGPMLV